MLSPEQVAVAGEGSLKNGHDTLDSFVKHIRKLNIKTLKGLPGPVRGVRGLLHDDAQDGRQESSEYSDQGGRMSDRDHRHEATIRAADGSPS